MQTPAIFWIVERPPQAVTEAAVVQAVGRARSDRGTSECAVERRATTLRRCPPPISLPVDVRHAHWSRMPPSASANVSSDGCWFPARLNARTHSSLVPIVSRFALTKSMAYCDAVAKVNCNDEPSYPYYQNVFTVRCYCFLILGPVHGAGSFS